MTEIKASCVKTSNNMHGTDLLTVQLLQAAWPEAGEKVETLEEGRVFILKASQSSLAFAIYSSRKSRVVPLNKLRGYSLAF